MYAVAFTERCSLDRYLSSVMFLTTYSVKATRSQFSPVAAMTWLSSILTTCECPKSRSSRTQSQSVSLSVASSVCRLVRRCGGASRAQFLVEANELRRLQGNHCLSRTFSSSCLKFSGCRNAVRSAATMTKLRKATSTQQQAIWKGCSSFRIHANHPGAASLSNSILSHPSPTIPNAESINASAGSVCLTGLGMLVCAKPNYRDELSAVQSSDQTARTGQHHCHSCGGHCHSRQTS